MVIIMSNVQMKAYKVSEIVFKNEIKGSVQLHFSNKISHNVRYTSNGMCEASLNVEVFDKNQPDILNVKVTVKGLFEVKQGVEKEFVHVDTFKELFPLVKALVVTVSANAGIQPIIVQNVDIEKQEIYRFDMNAARRTEEEQ